MLERRPLVIGARPTPGLDQVARRIEFHDRRRTPPDRTRFVGLKRGWPLDNPDMIARIHRHAGDRANDPVIGQRLWPERINAIRRRLRRSSQQRKQKNQSRKAVHIPGHYRKSLMVSYRSFHLRRLSMTHNPDRRTALLGLAVAAGTAAFGSTSARAAQGSGASLPA